MQNRDRCARPHRAEPHALVEELVEPDRAAREHARDRDDRGCDPPRDPTPALTGSVARSGDAASSCVRSCRFTSSPNANPVSDPSAARDYYQVEDESGARFWLFRAGLYDAHDPPKWWLHGLFG